MDGAASFNRFHSSASANQYSDSEYSISLFAISATSRHMSSNTANSSFEYICRPHSVKSIPRYKGGQTYNSVMQLDTCVKAFPNMSKIKLRRWSCICNTNEPHAFRCKRSRSSYRNPQMPLITTRSICSGTAKPMNTSAATSHSNATATTPMNVNRVANKAITAVGSWITRGNEGAFLLRQCGEQVQHERINVRPKLRDQEGHLVGHEATDEMDVAAKAVQLRDG
jgi:hypothetical protein